MPIDVYQVASESRNKRRKYWTDINHGKTVKLLITPKVLADIFARVEVDPVTGCWPWPGAKDQKGYAQKRIGGMARRLSRVMVQTFIRQLRAGEQANHEDECRNPKCVNPAHLAPLGISANTADGNRQRRNKRLASMLKSALMQIDNPEFVEKAMKYLAKIPETRNG